MKTGYTVHDCMTTKPISISEEATVQEAAKLMADHRIGAVLVKHDGKATGILSDQDIVRHFVAKGINPLTKKVKDYRVKELITIAPEADLYEALVKMRDQGIRHLPVVENHSLIGLLTLKDILKIEPALFDLMVEKFEIVDEERKMRSTKKALRQEMDEEDLQLT